MSVSTFSPVAGANSPCDGYVENYYIPGTYTFATLISQTTGAITDVTGTSIYLEINTGTTTNCFNRIGRDILNFDTSALGAGATITGVTLSLYGVSKTVGLGDTSVHIVSATPAGTANVVVGDLGQLGSTTFGNIPSISGLSLAGYTVITLNASGIAYINKIGVTSLGLKLGWDYSGSFTGTWASNQYTSPEFYSADKGVGFLPILTVTYSTGNTSSFLAFFN